MVQIFRRIFLTVLAAAGVSSVGSPSLAQMKTEADGPFKITSFVQSGNVTLAVMLPKAAYTDMAYYAGPCGADLTFDLSVSDRKKLSVFESSGRFADLQAGELTDRLAQRLEGLCPQLQTLEAVLATRPDKPVVATLRKSSNWKNTSAALSAQDAANPLDKQIAQAPTGKMVPLAFQDPFSRVAVQALVECKAEVTIPLKSMKSNAARKIGLSQYVKFAESAAPQFALQCPEVERIKFIAGPLPSHIACPAGTCYLDARASAGAWTVTRTGFGGAKSNARFDTFEDVIKAMIKGDVAELRRDYSGYYRLFHNQFLNVYSTSCSANISNPKTFQITPIETTIDGNGFTVGSRKAGKTFTLNIDPKFEERYFTYEDLNKARLTSRILGSEVSARAGGSSSAGMQSVVSQLTADYDHVRRFIGQGCTSGDVQTVYSGLDSVLRK